MCKKLLKSGQAAKFLNVSQRTFQDWVKKGFIIPVKIAENGYNYFSEDQLINFCKISVDLFDNKHNFEKTASIKNKSAQHLKKNADIEVASFLPVTKHKVPNDKIARTIFNMNDEQHNMGQLLVAEGEIRHKIRGNLEVEKIITPISLDFSRYIEEFAKSMPKLNAFDREVLFACISEQAAGNLYTTADIIYRNMTGDDDRRHSMPGMFELIRNSIDKLRFCRVEINLREICKKWGYNGGNSIVLDSVLLPGEYIRTMVNGKTTDMVIKFFALSPLIRAAEIKNGQILTYDKSLLNVPIRNSPDIIVIKNYLFRRIQEIIVHKMAPVITFDDIWDKNGMSNYSNTQKQRLRKHISTMLNFWTGSTISGHIINRIANIPYSITILLPQTTIPPGGIQKTVKKTTQNLRNFKKNRAKN